MFESVHNYHEEAVFQAVSDSAWEYPDVAENPELLADVACVALNRISPRYIRNKLDMTFYLDEQERLRNDAAVQSAVAQAFAFVTARLNAGARAQA